jgi:hypothetical protein
MKPEQVPGALEGLNKLREMGFRLVLVTARHTNEESRTKQWLDHHYPGMPSCSYLRTRTCDMRLAGMFDKLICTGQFRTDLDGKEVLVKIGKAEV